MLQTYDELRRQYYLTKLGITQWVINNKADDISEWVLIGEKSNPQVVIFADEYLDESLNKGGLPRFIKAWSYSLGLNEANILYIRKSNLELKNKLSRDKFIELSFSQQLMPKLNKKELKLIMVLDQSIIPALSKENDSSDRLVVWNKSKNMYLGESLSSIIRSGSLKRALYKHHPRFKGFLNQT